MPDFSADDINIEPYEYVGACNSSEIKELIQELIDEGHIKRDAVVSKTGPSSPSIGDSMFEDSLNTLYSNRLQLTLEEEEVINKLAQRFKYL